MKKLKSIIYIIFMLLAISCNKSSSTNLTEEYPERKANIVNKVEENPNKTALDNYSIEDIGKLSCSDIQNELPFENIIQLIFAIDETKIGNKDYGASVKMLLIRLINFNAEKDKPISKVKKYSWANLDIHSQESTFCWKISSPNLTSRVVNKIGVLLFSACTIRDISLYEETLGVLSASNCDAALPYIWNVMNSIDGKITDHPLAITALRGIRSRASVITALNYYGENKVAQKVVLKMLTHKSMDLEQLKKWIYENIEFIQFNDDGYMYSEKDFWGSRSAYEYFLPSYDKILTLKDK